MHDFIGVPQSVTPEVRRSLQSDRLSSQTPVLILFLRVGLFTAWQAVFALIFFLAGNPTPWSASIRLWPFAAGLGSLSCLWAISGLLKNEGIRYGNLISIQRGSVIKDALVTAGLFFLGGPVSYIPNILLGKVLFGDSTITTHILFQPMPLWMGVFAIILFPAAVAYTELPTYFAYIAPRLKAAGWNRWAAVLTAAFFLAFQHVALPWVWDGRFMIWRILMFLPFAIYAGLILHWRPRLLPYMMIGHLLMDLSTAVFFLPGLMP